MRFHAVIESCPSVTKVKMKVMPNNALERTVDYRGPHPRRQQL